MYHFRFFKFVQTKAYIQCRLYKKMKRCFHFSSTVFKECLKVKKDFSDGPPWRILFFGTDGFALESLKPLCAKLRTGTLMKSLGVVTKKDSLIRQFAEEEKLEIYEWPLSQAEIERLNYDLGMVVSFGSLIPKSIIDTLQYGCLNIHASLLPRWRGASPILHAIMNGDTETGVTAMRIHPYRFDVGEIVRQYRIPIGHNETALQLEKRLSEVGAQILMECLRDIPYCIERAVPQSENGITYAPKVKASSAVVDWKKMDAHSVYNLHRALHHIYPLRTQWFNHKVKLLEVTPDEDSAQRIDSGKFDSDLSVVTKSALEFLNTKDAKNVISECRDNTSVVGSNIPGSIEYRKTQNHFEVICADARKILVWTVLVSGKVMTGKDFYNGFLSKKKRSEWKFS